MKLLCPLMLVLTLLSRPLFAQDLLTKRTGEELLVKVIEITPSEVKYRRADNPDGPLITMWKSEVFLIRYANGTREVFNGTGMAGAPPASRPAVAPALPAAVPSPAPPTVPGAVPGAVPVVGNAAPNDAMLTESIHLDGPRLGGTFLSQGVVDKAKENGISLNPFITQFGWQFESRLFRLPSGVSGLLEFVPLVGGLEQNKFIPSISALLGVRGDSGFEFGVGPNLTPLGASVVLAAGATVQASGINIPINVAVVPGEAGTRISLLIGFNTRSRR